MSRNFSVRHLRGLKANIPVLDVSELYFTTDTNELYCGSLSGNIPIGIPIFDPTGTRVPAPHIVVGQVKATNNNQAVTLSGDAVFTSATSYTVVANDTSGNHTIQVVKNSGSSFNLRGQSSNDVVNFICVGN